MQHNLITQIQGTTTLHFYEKSIYSRLNCSKKLISNLTALTAFNQEACHKMGKTAREDIENRICECKFFLEIPEIIPIYMYTHIILVQL